MFLHEVTELRMKLEVFVIAQAQELQFYRFSSVILLVELGLLAR